MKDAKEDEKDRVEKSALVFEARVKKRNVRRFPFDSNRIRSRQRRRTKHATRASIVHARPTRDTEPSVSEARRPSRTRRDRRRRSAALVRFASSWSERSEGVLRPLRTSFECATRSILFVFLPVGKRDLVPTLHADMERTSEACRFGTRSMLVRRTRVARVGWTRRVSLESARNGGLVARSSLKGHPEALEIRVGEGFLRFETGEIGRQASGSVIATSGETVRSF